MNETEQNERVLAIDIGGTKTAAALVDGAGRVLSRGRVATPDTDDPIVLVEAVGGLAQQVLGAAGAAIADVSAVGVSCAGIIDTQKGVVVFSPNIPSLRRTPLRSMLSERLGMPVRVGNDATLAALGEWQFGLNRAVADLVYITVSTGIGGGIVAGGKLYEGSCGAAGEVGHMVIDVNGPECPCGRHGCWESLASGRALAERTALRIEEGEASSIGELVGGDLGKIDAQLVSIAAQQGDALAQEMIATTAFYVGVGLANLINLFNPSLILIGGGLSKIGEALLGPAAAVAKERAYVADACDVEIRSALLGDDSPLLGAAALAMGRIA